MEILLLILLLAFLIEGIAILFLARQIGFILIRIPPEELASKEMQLGQKAIYFPGVDERYLKTAGWNFIFASFSCPLCRPILEKMSSLSPEIKKRTSLLLLEPDISENSVKNKIDQLNLKDVILLNGYEFVSKFGVKQTPFLLAIDSNGNVIKREFIRMVSQISMNY